MQTARIYQAPKSSMSSGRGRMGKWVLEFDPAEPKRADPLTGWAGSGDTRGQIQLKFATKDEAIAYADREGIPYHVVAAPQPSLKLQAYADNFR